LPARAGGLGGDVRPPGAPAAVPALPADSGLALEDFLPYRLSVLANRISRGLARMYSEKFDLSVAEWRVMAALGQEPGTNANHVCRVTAMDKVRVSRAVARLVKMGRLIRESDRSDRRRAKLYLSEEGRAVYDEIVPLALAYEADVLGVLDEDDRVQLDRRLDRLADAAPAEPGD